MSDVLFSAPVEEKKVASLKSLLGMDLGSVDISKRIQLAEDGHKAAMGSLGLCYFTGTEGVQKDYLEAIYWFEENGDEQLYQYIGDCYRNLGNLKMAEEWYLKSPDKGLALSYKLCALYINKEFNDFDNAEKYLRQCLEFAETEGDIKIVYQLADLFGTVLSRINKERALYWFKFLVEKRGGQEDIDNLFKLCKKIVLDKNATPSVAEEAADYLYNNQDKWDAETSIAVSGYYNKVDKERYYKTLEKSAELNVTISQLIMALNYTQGVQGELSKDLKKARYYLNMIDISAYPKMKDEYEQIKRLLAKEEALEQEKNSKHLTEEIATQMVKELEGAGRTILQIPEGYTHIDSGAFLDYSVRKPRIKYVKKITEVVFPNSLQVIDSNAFCGCIGLTKFVFPKNIKEIGAAAFDGINVGAFNITIKDKRVIDKIVIPGGAVAAEGAFDGIGKIKEFIVEEGPVELRLSMLGSNSLQKGSIGYLYIPDSVQNLLDTNFNGLHFVIDKISAPKHLLPQIKKYENTRKVKNVEYR